MNRRIQSIIEHWSLKEGALFETVCTHRMESTPSLSIPFRCGHGVIEYNEELLEKMPDAEVALGLKAEVIRILLKHPYQRQPEGCSKYAIGMGSDLVLSDSYPEFSALDMPTPSEFGLDPQQSFEWYAKMVESQQGQGGQGENDDEEGDGDGDDDDADCNGSAELSELWEEDCMMAGSIDSIIEDIKEKGAWGSLAGNIEERIKAASTPKVDYKRILLGLKPSHSSARTLTRMKPNRRFGFDAMGSREGHRFKLLVGVDVSGSVSSEALSQFFGVIIRLFKHEVEDIDVITFDTELAKPMKIKKAVKEIAITGRGGTDFQPIIDYAEKHPEYDGLIVFTDGLALPPHKSGNTKVVWVCDTEENFAYSRKWMEELGKCCYIHSQG